MSYVHRADAPCSNACLSSTDGRCCFPYNVVNAFGLECLKQAPGKVIQLFKHHTPHTYYKLLHMMHQSQHRKCQSEAE